jgi:hypothetical protein
MGLSITERLANGPVLGAEGYVFEPGRGERLQHLGLRPG